MGRFGSGWTGWDNILAFPMFGTPNGWRLNPDGTLVNAIETDEYRQGLDFLRQLFADGAYHPDSAGMNFSDAQNNFIGGNTGLHFEGFLSFFGKGSVTDKMQVVNPSAETVGFVPPAASGGPGLLYNEAGIFGMTAIPASLGGDEERVRELLRILDYLAAPFGSEERIFLESGLEGVHHEVNEEGLRVTNDRLGIERSDLVAVMGGLAVYYYPENPGLAERIQDQALEAMAVGIDDPTLGLYSEASVSNASTLEELGTDRVTAIITGREPLEALNDAVQEWRNRGGDQIRQEYEQALSEQ
jgi:putative aldouronate transport system substrate-binding protein